MWQARRASSSAGAGDQSAPSARSRETPIPLAQACSRRAHTRGASTRPMSPTRAARNSCCCDCARLWSCETWTMHHRSRCACPVSAGAPAASRKKPLAKSLGRAVAELSRASECEIVVCATHSPTSNECRHNTGCSSQARAVQVFVFVPSTPFPDQSPAAEGEGMLNMRGAGHAADHHDTASYTPARRDVLGMSQCVVERCPEVCVCPTPAGLLRNSGWCPGSAWTCMSTTFSQA